MMGQDSGHVCFKCHPKTAAETWPGDPNRLEEPERVRLLETAPGGDGSDGSGIAQRGSIR